MSLTLGESAKENDARVRLARFRFLASSSELIRFIPYRWITSRPILIPIIREKVVPDSMVYTDGFRSYDVLDVSEFKHERVDYQ